MIEMASVADRNGCLNGHWPQLGFPDVPPNIFKEPMTVNLEVSDDELLEISERGLLALNLEEMKAIQSHYRDPAVRAERTEQGLQSDRPTDAELECLAQTWSEHCSHKIFAAKIRHVDKTTDEDTTINSLFKTHIMPKRGRLATKHIP